MAGGGCAACHACGGDGNHDTPRVTARACLTENCFAHGLAASRCVHHWQALSFLTRWASSHFCATRRFAGQSQTAVLESGETCRVLDKPCLERRPLGYPFGYSTAQVVGDDPPNRTLPAIPRKSQSTTTKGRCTTHCRHLTNVAGALTSTSDPPLPHTENKRIDCSAQGAAAGWHAWAVPTQARQLRPPPKAPTDSTAFCTKLPPCLPA